MSVIKNINVMRTKFTIFKNKLVGETKKANDVFDLLENTMTKNDKKFWSCVKFKDKNNKTIQITREFLDQGMSVECIIHDWVLNGDLEDDIISIN